MNKAHTKFRAAEDSQASGAGAGKVDTGSSIPSNPPARDEVIWALNTRVQNLHRSQQALRHLLRRTQSEEARLVAVTAEGLGHAPQDAPPAEEAPDPWWPGVALPDTPLVPPPGVANAGLTTEPAGCIAFLVTGLTLRDLEQAVANVREDLSRHGGFKPLFLTDNPDLSPFIREGHAAEYLPPERLTGEAADGGWPVHRLETLRRKWGFEQTVDLRETRAAPPPPRRDQRASPTPPRASGKRPKAAVVAWDLGHNPAGRAMVIYDLLARDYDVELVGPVWSRFGNAVWEPIRQSDRKVRAFACETIEDFWPRAVALTAAADYDLVVACKPRLPAVLLAALIKQACGCPLVLDIDDFELSFFKDETPADLSALEAAGPDVFREPYLELPTRVCDALAGLADARIVSNIALRDRFGGHIVRHARDEALFDPRNFDRDGCRAAMGMEPDDFAIVFVGTIRRHKGVIEVAQALHEHPDKRFSLHVIGDIPDVTLRKELARFTGARLQVHPGCAFEDLPERLVAADAVVLLQDPDHAISQFQIPAKVSDASALGLPVLATDVPPLRDLALQGLVRTIAPAELGVALDGLLKDRETGRAATERARIREGFEAELGFDVNRERLNKAIARAGRADADLPGPMAELITLSGRAYAELRSAEKPRVPAVSRGAVRQFDVAMFWKQNDSGLFARRSDMMMKHLIGSGRVRRVLQFDAPMNVKLLAAGLQEPQGSTAAHILRNAVDNQYHARDTERHGLRTFLWDDRHRRTALPGVGGSIDDYPDYVRAQMAAAGMTPEETIAWVFPVVFDFPRIAGEIPFRGIVGDLIDDQRLFAGREEYIEKVRASYVETLPLFDVTFTNCAPVAEAFEDLAGPIHVVPNGTEPMYREPGERPAALRGLDGPLAGYVGNLRDRFDWDLLREVALRMPGVNFPIVGGGARPEDAAKVAGLPNVHLVGVCPHHEVPEIIAAFDLALVPHVKGPLTQRMNPLKIYNYFSARKAIVSTELDNIDTAIRPYIRFADNVDGFAAAIDEAIRTPLHCDPAYDAALSGILWETRVAEILKVLDRSPGLTD